jgi:Glycosyltransferase
MLLTFGLLSPNKGIEYVIEALPAILKEHPNVVYIVLGATHPNLLSREGESYRLKLERLAEDRGVGQCYFLQSLRDAGGTNRLSSARPTFTSPRILTKRKSLPAPWPMLSAQVKR